MQWHQGMLDRSRRRATHRCEARKQHRHGRDMHHKQGGDDHVTDQHGRCCRRHQLAGAVSGHRRRVAAAGKLAVQCMNDNRMPYEFDTHHVVEADAVFASLHRRAASSRNAGGPSRCRLFAWNVPCFRPGTTRQTTHPCRCQIIVYTGPWLKEEDLQWTGTSKRRSLQFPKPDATSERTKPSHYGS